MNPKPTTSSTSTRPRHATYAASGQLDLFLDSIIPTGENPALWTPRDIWVRANQRLLEYLNEDRRFERKATRQINFEELAKYYSAFSNTPDGGMIVFGIEKG